MTKLTVASLAATVDTLVERLDKAAAWAEKAQAKITALEAQEDKTRKQLWYLQKIAKGEFAIGKPKANGEATEEVAETIDNVDGCF